MDLKDERVRALIPTISEEIYKLIFQYKGSITAEHNDGLIRTPYLEEMYGPKIIELFNETKKIFDPLDIFNPGKKVDGDLKYSEAHIASTPIAAVFKKSIFSLPFLYLSLVTFGYVIVTRFGPFFRSGPPLFH